MFQTCWTPELQLSWPSRSGSPCLQLLGHPALLLESAVSPTYAISLSGQLGCLHAAIRELAAILLFRERG